MQGCCGNKKELLEEIADEIRNCHKCSLSESRTNAVPGEGDPCASIVLIGEAPGYWEDRMGRPFVGAAGRLLNDVLGKIGLKREEIFITNVLKCRPPGNRDPRPDEVRVCTPFLDRQLDIIRPEFIVTLGRHSTAYIFEKMKLKFYGISRVHGRIYKVKFPEWKCRVIPTYHPAAALYNVNLKEDILRDMLRLKENLSAFME